MTLTTKYRNDLIGIVALLTLAGLSGCSFGPTKPEQEIKAPVGGPSVLFARSEPGTIELNRDLQPMKAALVIADIKDLKSRVTDVRLQFAEVPLEIPMENTEGSTWRAELTQRQLEMLAVSGKTIKYQAQIVAKNENGQVSISENPIEVEVKAPESSKELSDGNS